MPAIWKNDGSNWQLLSPTGFPDEETLENTLHSLVADAPQVLPLAGTPQVVIVGRQVTLGNGTADLIAVDPSGQLAIIEIKLKKNSEARRAVVAQVLAYAAYIRGLTVPELEQQVLARHLSKRHYASLADAVRAQDQTSSFDPTDFAARLSTCLATGAFRLVIVLDEAPPDLIRLVGYLEDIADRLIIDLITVAAYEVGGSQIVVPQRVEPVPPEPPALISVRPWSKGRTTTLGADDFEATIDDAPEADQSTLRDLVKWARELERKGLATLYTGRSKGGQLSLMPLVPGLDSGLVTVWKDPHPSIQLWRSTMEKRAPRALARLEQDVAPEKAGQLSSVGTITPTVLDALTAAYEEASQSKTLDVSPEAGDGDDADPPQST